MSDKTDRRGFFQKTLLAAAGVGAACTLEEQILLAAHRGWRGNSRDAKAGYRRREVCLAARSAT